MTHTTEELRKLAGKITRGPWQVGPFDDTRVEDADGNEVAQIDGDYNQPETWPLMEANARAIALVPYLLAEVIRLREAVEATNVQKVHKMDMGDGRVLISDTPIPPGLYGEHTPIKVRGDTK